MESRISILLRAQHHVLMKKVADGCCKVFLGSGLLQILGTLPISKITCNKMKILHLPKSTKDTKSLFTVGIQ